MFVDANGADDIAGTEDDDLRLASSGAPGIDAGTNAVMTVSTDLDGFTRIHDGDGNGVATVDIGGV